VSLRSLQQVSISGLVSLVVCFFVAANFAHGQQTYDVNSSDAFEELIESGKLAAGDTIQWAAGTYRDVDLDITGVDGSEGQPITLQAETPGATIICGESQFNVGARHWIIKGFHFIGFEGETNAYNTLQFRSNGGQAASHVKLTDCAFTDLTTDSATSKWILIFGQSNSIERCHFSGKNSKGAMITVELEYLNADEVAGHSITGNYFADFASQKGSDNETIRLGTSKDQNKPARCVVEGNYFVGCNGEPFANAMVP